MTTQRQHIHVTPWTGLRLNRKKENPITRQSHTPHLRQSIVAVESIRWLVSIAFCLSLINSSWAQSIGSVDPMVHLKIVPTSIQPVGSLELQISRPEGSDTERYFLNVFIDMNRDGLIGSVVEAGVKEWQIRNYPVTLNENEPTAMTTPPFYFGAGSDIPDLTGMQVSISPEPISEQDLDEELDNLQDIIIHNVIEAPRDHEQPLPIVMMKCPKQVDFAGEEQVEFDCTLITMHGKPTAAEYFFNQLTGGALVEGTAVIADEVVIQESTTKDFATSQQNLITLAFVATRTDQQLPSDWSYRARAVDATIATSSTEVKISVGNSVGDLRFVDTLVATDLDSNEFALGEVSIQTGDATSSDSQTTTLFKPKISVGMLTTFGKTDPVDAENNLLILDAEGVKPKLQNMPSGLFNDSFLIGDMVTNNLPNLTWEQFDDGVILTDDKKGTTDKDTGTVVDPPEEEYEIGAPITPEHLIGKLPAQCQMTFAETRNGIDYKTPPAPLSKKQLTPITALYGLLPVKRATIYYAVIPGEIYYEIRPGTLLGPYVPPGTWSTLQAKQEIERTIRWYAQYCIFLTFKPVTFKGKTFTKLKTIYDTWLNTIPKNVKPGNTLSTGVVKAGGLMLRKLQGSLELVARLDSKNMKGAPPLTVLFLKSVAQPLSRALKGRERLTEASMSLNFDNGIVMHGEDRDDPYILSHELIHALGRTLQKAKMTYNLVRGRLTWFHSNNKVAMSNLVRKKITQPAKLSFQRLLDFGEYVEIVSSGQLK